MYIQVDADRDGWIKKSTETGVYVWIHRWVWGYLHELTGVNFEEENVVVKVRALRIQGELSHFTRNQELLE